MSKFRLKFYKYREEALTEALDRMKAGSSEYAGKDITLKTANLMGRDLIVELIQEHLDAVNYNLAQVVKLRLIAEAIDGDALIQRVCPNGKPKKKVPG